MLPKTGVKIQRRSAGPYCALNITAYWASACEAKETDNNRGFRAIPVENLAT